MPRNRIALPKTFPTYTEQYLLKWYRINRARFDSMLQEQNGCCWVCLRPFEPDRQPNIDHDQYSAAYQARTASSKPNSSHSAPAASNRIAPDLFDTTSVDTAQYK